MWAREPLFRTEESLAKPPGLLSLLFHINARRRVSIIDEFGPGVRQYEVLDLPFRRVEDRLLELFRYREVVQDIFVPRSHHGSRRSEPRAPHSVSVDSGSELYGRLGVWQDVLERSGCVASSDGTSAKDATGGFFEDGAEVCHDVVGDVDGKFREGGGDEVRVDGNGSDKLLAAMLGG